MGKGSNRRPPCISRQHEELQWKLAYGYITFADYERKLKELKRQGKA